MSLNEKKTDDKLGLDVKKYLIDKGVETPTWMYHRGFDHSDLGKIVSIQNNFKDIMITMGMDLDDDSLKDTPRRLAEMYVNELFWGLRYENFPKITTVENKMNYDEMVLERNISVMSTCEHHFQTIAGNAHVAYIPKNKVLGLSKMNRVVEYFSRRPQIQERLTEQVYYALSYILDTEDVAVVIDAEHFCVKARGVEDMHSNTITSKLGGGFRSNAALRAEFMNLIK